MATETLHHWCHSGRCSGSLTICICAKGIKVRSEDPKHSRKHDNDLRLVRGITKFAHYVVLHKVMYLQRTLVFIYFFFFFKKLPDDGKSSQFDTYLPQKISILTRDMFAVSYLCLEDKYYYAATCRSTQQVFFGRTDEERRTFRSAVVCVIITKSYCGMLLSFRCC